MTIHKRTLLVVLCLGLALGSFVPAVAQPQQILPVRLTDTQTLNPGSQAQLYVEYHGAAYFLAYANGGSGLWKTDGTAAGTSIVLSQVYPIDAYETGSPYILFKDELYFQSNIGLVKTDGTPGQYTQIYAAGVPSIRPVVMGEYLYFIPFPANLGDGVFQLQLWRTDGTPAGTQMVASSNSSGDIAFYSGAALAVFNNRLFFQFLTGDDAELWSSDGTAAGTALFMDLYAGGSSFPQNLTVFNGNLFFSAQGSDGISRLWRSDGSPAGTVLFADAAQNWVYLRCLTVVGSHLLFTTIDTPIVRLWLTDGAPQNTIEIELKDGGTQYTLLESTLSPVGAKLYFFARSPAGSALWVTDGLPAGTQLVHKLVGNSTYTPYRGVTVVQGRLFFADSLATELWSSDGTPSGTVLVKKVIPEDMIALSSRLIFTGNDQYNGPEPWQSDGTPGGTAMILNLRNDLNQDFPQIYVPAATRLYFVPLEGLKTTPMFRLWMSNGQPEGTGPLAVDTICDDVGEIYMPMRGRYLAAMGDILLYPGPSCALWRTDGTTAGTWKVPNANWDRYQNTAPFLTPLGQRFFFFSNPNLNGMELWISDGSQDPAGTFKLGQISNSCDRASLPQPPVVMNGVLYFVTASNTTGCQQTTWWKLWRSDGTPGGTQILAATETANYLPPPNYLTVSGARVYFYANQSQTANLLWESDGSLAGTHPVDSIARSIYNLADRNGSLMIFEQPYSVLPTGKWLYTPRLETTRGSASGGVQTVINYAAFETFPYAELYAHDMVGVGNQVYFIRYYDGSSYDQLWVSDGTTGGTHAVLREDGTPLHVINLASGGGQLFFSAPELWTSNGTPAGTHLIADLYAFTLGSSHLQGYSWINHRLFFFADDGIHGPELWVYHDRVNQVRLPLVNH